MFDILHDIYSLAVGIALDGHSPKVYHYVNIVKLPQKFSKNRNFFHLAHLATVNNNLLIRDKPLLLGVLNFS